MANTSGISTSGDNAERNGVMSRVRESAAAQLSTQKDRATDGLGSVAQAVRQSTQQLREEQHETLAGYVESAADEIERLSQRLRSKDIGELLDDVQHLARRQPAAVIGGAFVLGLLGVRFLKSSSRSSGRDRYEDRGRVSPYRGAGYGGAPYGRGAEGRSGVESRPAATYPGGTAGGAIVAGGRAGNESETGGHAAGPGTSGATGGAASSTGDREAGSAADRTSGPGKGNRASRGSGKTERS